MSRRNWFPVLVALMSSVAGAQTQPWRAWSDALPLPAADRVRAELDRARLYRCGPAKPVTTGPATLPEALRAARVHLNATEPAGMKAFQASEDARDAPRAKAAALAASLAGRPGAAAAALLAAHEKAPEDAEILVNLGGALTLLGRPAEALAVLDAAGRAGYPKDAALGWSTQGVALNNRGHALQALGRTAEAEAALRRAVQVTPDLSEARANLGLTLACAGKFDEAVQFARSAARRTALPTQPATPARPGEVTPPPTEVRGDRDPQGLQETRRPVTWAFDVSGGRSMNLPNLKLPLTPQQAVAMQRQYQQLDDELADRGAALGDRMDDLSEALADAPDRPLLMTARQRALLTAARDAASEPHVKPLWAAVRTLEDEVDALWTDFWHCEGRCQIDRMIEQASRSGDYTAELRRLCVPALRAEHDTWRGAMHQLATRLAQATEAQYRLQTGLAANTSDPRVHELISLQAEQTAINGLSTLTHLALLWSTDIEQYQDGCVEGPGEPVSGALAAPLVTDRSDLCREGADRLSLSLSIRVVQISVTCDRASLKLATPGWIGAFGKVDRAHTGGSITVAVGAEAGVELPLTTAGVKAAGGFYVTLNSDLEFQDVGVMTEAKVSASGKAGPLKLGGAVKGVSGRWSFIAGP